MRTPEELFDFTSASYLGPAATVRADFSRILNHTEPHNVAKRLFIDTIATVYNRGTTRWAPGKVLLSLPPSKWLLKDFGEHPGFALIVSGPGSYKWARHSKMPRMFTTSVSRTLLEAISSGNRDHAIERLPRAYEHYRSTLRNSRIAALMLSANYSPGFRLLGLAARDEGIPVINYPHGMLGNPATAAETDYGLTDFWLTWTLGELQSLIATGVTEERAHHIGPYRDVLRCKPGRPSGTVKVLFVGSRGTYGLEKLMQASAEAIAHTCRNSDADFVFRPHPLANMALVSSAPILASTTSKAESLVEAICNSDVVVGFPSTALLESKEAGRYTVCLTDIPPLLRSLDAQDFSHTSISATSFSRLIVERVALQEASQHIVSEPEQTSERFRDFLTLALGVS